MNEIEERIKEHSEQLLAEKSVSKQILIARNILKLLHQKRALEIS